MSNKEDDVLEKLINNCTIEEADARLIRHCNNLLELGYANIVLRPADNDVLILLISKTGVKNVHFQLAVPHKIKYYNVIEIKETNGNKTCMV